MTTFLLIAAVWLIASLATRFLHRGRLLARRSAELDDSISRHPAGRGR